MALGVRSTDAELVVFLDGDLTGLAPHHIDRLVRTVDAGGAIMCCGLFDRGPMLNLLFLHVLPILTGQRCMRRELFEALAPDDIRGYRIEAALNCRATEVGQPIAAFVSRGMFHRTKEEKYAAPLQGWLAKLSMLTTGLLGVRALPRAAPLPASQGPDRPGPRRACPDGASVCHAGSSPGAVSRTPGPSTLHSSRQSSPSQRSS